MYSKPIYLTSDVHLGAVSEDTQSSFIEWLEWAASNCDQLIINGDLFDFWFEFRTGIPNVYDRPLAALKNVVQSGVEVTLVGGNHDWWGGRYLCNEIGLTFESAPCVRKLAGFTTFLAHGDGLGSNENIYKLLRYTLRSRLTRYLFSLLEPKWGTTLGLTISRTSKKRGKPSSREHETSEILKRWAFMQLQNQPRLEIIVLGHTHIPCIAAHQEGRYYINTGDWIYHRTFAVLKPEEKPYLCTWNRGHASTYSPEKAYRHSKAHPHSTF
ncbi:MAG: hypothetical protein CME30_03220 [Gemmatimonadetes bacterium]|nr:hypothetical protein [Gemmatimonadota bacterium]